MRSRATSCSSTQQQPDATARRRSAALAGLAAGRRPPRNLLLAVLGAIVALAWASLWWLEQWPGGAQFHVHGIGEHARHGAASGWLRAGTFLAGWLLMTVAMMLPTTVPLVVRFRAMVARHPHPALLVSLLLAGYAAAWLAFGTLVLALLRAAEFGQARLGWLSGEAWAVLLLATAGAFQFSPLKYACLARCRTPLGFLMSHWHGRRAHAEALGTGWWHGLYCVGCCWALMLLMFAMGTLSLTAMLLLALVMAAEKNAPWGQRLGRPLGVGLLGLAAGLGLYQLAA